jgi:hypothetical protein
MALSENAKRRAVSAVAAVRDDIHRVITTGSTGYDIFGQPKFDPHYDNLEIGWVTRWRENRDRDAQFQETLGKLRDVDAPGE